LVELRASYGSQEEKEKLLKILEQQDYLKVVTWPKKEYPGKGKSPNSKIYLELSVK